MNVVAATTTTAGAVATTTPAQGDAADVDASTPPAPVPRPRRFPCLGDAPGPRCGHTLTAITGPDGNLASARLVLFGGATALEGTARGDGAPPASPGPSPAAAAAGSGIRLAGATSDVHILDVRSGRWQKATPLGEHPSPRAAHAAAAVGSMVVVQGGIGPAGLASEDLHVLDFTEPDRPRWHRVMVSGPGPSARYAHTLSLVANRFLVAAGGNDGRQTLADAWALDTSDKPYQWRRIDGTPSAAATAAAAAAAAAAAVKAEEKNPSSSAAAAATTATATATPDYPAPRMYASAAARSDGLLLLCGGRGADGAPLDDAFGLARHRDGRWEWAAAPGTMPGARYQHGAVFVGARLHVSGGAVGGGKLVDDGTAVAVLDTAAGVWCVPDDEEEGNEEGGGAAGAAGASKDNGKDASATGGDDEDDGDKKAMDIKREEEGGGDNKDTAAKAAADAENAPPGVLVAGGRRCRHAVASVGPFVFTYGGLRGSTLLDDFLLSDDSTGGELSIYDPRSPAWREWLETFRGSDGAAAMLAEAAAEEAAAAAALSVRRVGTIDDLRCLDEDLGTSNPAAAGGAIAGAAARFQRGDVFSEDSESPYVLSLAQRRSGSAQRTPITPDVRLYHRAVVVAQEATGSLRGMVRQLSIDQFENESRRVSMGTDSISKALPSPMFERNSNEPCVSKLVLRELLHPRTWKPSEDRSFLLSAEQINQLCDTAESIFREEPSVLQLQAPVKIFGDLHGQFGDLMRLFEEYGTPSTAGDITYIDYLFLGDYVDRGSHSLETICLLLALKIEHPSAVHLIRGNHEAADINALFGFRLECIERLGDPHGVWAWTRLNALFNYLPLAALIEDRILCMHGGIGRSISRIEQIAELQRPLKMEDGGLVLMDLLWSDPTTNDAVEGVQPSPRGPGLVTFGPDRVIEFCKENELQMIVRAHECVMDGFERFAQGHLITLFSATNYCGTANNAGAILVLGRDLVMVPKLIHPLPPTPTSPKRSGSLAGGEGSGEGGVINEEGLDGGASGSGGGAGGGNFSVLDTWMASINEERPPTPPRGRAGTGVPNSLAFFE